MTTDERFGEIPARFFSKLLQTEDEPTISPEQKLRNICLNTSYTTDPGASSICMIYQATFAFLHQYHPTTSIQKLYQETSRVMNICILQQVNLVRQYQTKMHSGGASGDGMAVDLVNLHQYKVIRAKIKE